MFMVVAVVNARLGRWTMAVLDPLNRGPAKRYFGYGSGAGVDDGDYKQSCGNALRDVGT